ncbi:MAG TPA: Rieske (2Fe-2S) protein [Methylophaga aminisulfidivorans]|uniref:Rieske (2Fe-2S) protein n=1 Tax=Methylophaga aminisulfidivorans TaxID=230105 RepID=UPI001A14E8EF|nr:Rieske (2Fe-2S) protein [Methylophaga aminisulfidivorans]HIM39953.1 Rieske (2Fe-2S) protein [Methylophaga aminisulfidivorans]
MKNGIYLGELTDIPLGESRGFRPGGESRDQLFVVRLNASTVVAYRNTCPHKGYETASMVWKQHRYLDGSKQFIKCGSHGALFTLTRGECIHGPCTGQFLTAEKVTIEHNGSLMWWPHN